jgi:hypothetical protein
MKEKIEVVTEHKNGMTSLSMKEGKRESTVEASLPLHTKTWR